MLRGRCIVMRVFWLAAYARGLISARSAVERGETTHAMAALDNLATDVRVLQRTTEHWVAEADPKRGPQEPR